MTDKQFEEIRNGLQFHSESGIDNLCTMTETTLRTIIEDATKEIEKENVILKKEVQWLDMAINYDFPIADKLAELEKDKQYFSDSLDKQIEATLKLQQENAELDCQRNRNKFCYSCANATEKCYRNEIGCPCEKYKSYKEENAKLKNERNAFKIYSDGAELDAINLNDQLTKAKEIIREFVEWANWQGNSKCPSFKSIQDKAEQFLNSEVEK